MVLNKLVFSLTLSVITAVTAQVQPAKKQANAPALNDTAFVNLKEYSNDFVYDMKYATEDNLRLRYTIVRSVICA
jgi:D-alanyl-D-alanine dipeptidase